MDEREWLAERFEANRNRLRSVAYRMLGSLPDAEDAVQETWLRLNRYDASGIDNLAGWLTTVVARVSLDMLRSRESRREEPVHERGFESSVSPEEEALLGDSVGLALLVVLETLAPDERIAFVLHDMFGVPFDEIASALGRSPTATRQLASRARRRVQGADKDREADLTRQRRVVDAFLAASRNGDFAALVALLHPDIVLKADRASVEMGAYEEVRGAAAVAETFSGRARAARPALVDGAAGLVWASGGRLRVVFKFTVTDGKVVAIDMVADPERLRLLDVAALND
jgi:RNA polymerase sigma-70 factor, ECF subfamily